MLLEHLTEQLKLAPDAKITDGDTDIRKHHDLLPFLNVHAIRSIDVDACSWPLKYRHTGCGTPSCIRSTTVSPLKFFTRFSIGFGESPQMQFHILKGAPPRHAGEMEVPFPQIPGGGEHCIATGAMSKMQQAQVPVQVGSSAANQSISRAKKRHV